MTLAILISKDVYMGPGLYSQSSLFQKFFIPTFPQFGKIASESISAALFYSNTSFCFSTLFKTSLVLTLLSILLGCCLSPIQLKTFEKHLTVAIFFLEICKTETFLSCFYWYNKQNSKLSHHAFSFCVYYKAASIWKQIKR